MFFGDVLSLHSTYLSVSILDADVNSNHDENGNRDTEIANQTTDLWMCQENTTWSLHSNDFAFRKGKYGFSGCRELILPGQGDNDHS